MLLVPVSVLEFVFGHQSFSLLSLLLLLQLWPLVSFRLCYDDDDDGGHTLSESSFVVVVVEGGVDRSRAFSSLSSEVLVSPCVPPRGRSFDLTPPCWPVAPGPYPKLCFPVYRQNQCVHRGSISI